MAKQKKGKSEGISWTDESWNPIAGCNKVSPGCANCYAETVAERFRGTVAYPNGFELTLRPERLSQPLRWAKPRLIFVNSMSDVFHKDVPFEYIEQMFDVMNTAKQHTFQILTKRPEIMLEYSTRTLPTTQDYILSWSSNMWAGTSVENKDYIKRVDLLREVPAQHRFLSIEPLLGPIDELDLTDIHWVIVGGESGAKARPMEESWVRRLRDICLEQDVPFHFKQWGGIRKHETGHLLDGKEYRAFPNW